MAIFCLRFFCRSWCHFLYFHLAKEVASPRRVKKPNDRVSPSWPRHSLLDLFAVRRPPRAHPTLLRAGPSGSSAGVGRSRRAHTQTGRFRWSLAAAAQAARRRSRRTDVISSFGGVCCARASTRSGPNGRSTRRCGNRPVARLPYSSGSCSASARPRRTSLSIFAASRGCRAETALSPAHGAESDAARGNQASAMLARGRRTRRAWAARGRRAPPQADRRLSPAAAGAGDPAEALLARQTALGEAAAGQRPARRSKPAGGSSTAPGTRAASCSRWFTWAPSTSTTARCRLRNPLRTAEVGATHAALGDLRRAAGLLLRAVRQDARRRVAAHRAAREGRRRPVPGGGRRRGTLLGPARAARAGGHPSLASRRGCRRWRRGDRRGIRARPPGCRALRARGCRRPRRSRTRGPCTRAR